MTMKKTDLYKALAKKVGGQQKAERTPDRFGKAAKAVKAAATANDAAPQAAPVSPPKPVQVTLRLPATLVAQLRERALGHEAGISGVVADALDQHFNAKPARAARKKAASAPAAD